MRASRSLRPGRYGASRTRIAAAAATGIATLALAAASPATAEQPTLRAGQWRTTHQVIEGSGPAADMFRRALSASNEQNAADMDACLKKSTLGDLLEEVDGAASDEDCRRNVVSQTGKRIEVRYACDSGGGTTVLEWVSAERVKGRMEMSVKDPDGKTSFVRLESESRWLKAACDPGLED